MIIILQCWQKETLQVLFYEAKVRTSDRSWTPLHLDGGLKQIFPNFMPVNLAKYGVTIICRYSKDMNFHKIWRV